MEWDVFISHASEDKDGFARPLAEGLRRCGLKVWFDEFTLTVGDSLRRSIDRGLGHSRFGVVVISRNFLRKEWPQKELDGLVGREVGGVKVILPVWHGISANDIRVYSPTLADRLAASSDKGVEHVIAELMRAIQQDDQSQNTGTHEQLTDRERRAKGEALADIGKNQTGNAPIASSGKLNLGTIRPEPYTPRIRRASSDLEKRRFVQGAFETIAEHFEQALDLASHQEGVDVDFKRVSTTRFMAELFVNGESRRRCKIWIQNDEIAFSEGSFRWAGEDNSYNEMLSLVQDELALRALMEIGNEGDGLDLSHLTPEAAAEYLWRRFAARLN